MIIANIAKTQATAAIIIAISMPVFLFPPPSVLIITITKKMKVIIRRVTSQVKSEE
jgi:hypothetical protein